MTALVLATAAVTLLGQGRITNGQIDTRTATQSVEREIAAATSRGGVRWVGYRIKVASGRRSMDCLERSHIALEGAADVSILARFEGTALTRLRTATPECEIDAGGLPVTWLENVKADDSAAWLASIVSAPNADSGDRFSRVTKQAIAALGMHEGTAASRALVNIARNHPVSTARNDALFWLGQSNDPRALKFFEDVLLH